MEIQARRDFQILTEVEKNAAVTQRTLAKNLGVALGLTNLCVKRLARRGHIRIATNHNHRTRYLLTPRGMAEKSRLTGLYMRHSLSYYRDLRQRMRNALLGLTAQGLTRIVIYGTGEWAELAYVTLREMDLTIVGFVDGKPGRTFLSYSLWPVEALAKRSFDAVLIADLQDGKEIHTRLLREGVPKHKIISL